MKKSIILVCGVILSGLLAFNSHAGPGSVSDKQFTAIKSLVGTWEGYKEGERDQAVVLSYELSGDGSVVVEKIFKGTPKEMVTAYHQNGDKLMLTHYCMLKNQPRMEAARSDDANKIDFRFIDGTNMSAKKDMHMHSLALTRVSANELKQDWTVYQEGKPGPVSTFIFVRK
jgi:hypothetical protein